MDENSNLKLRDIDGGNVILQVDEEIAKIVADIADLNKVATKKRVVQLTLTFQPTKSRRESTVSYQVVSKPSTHIERDPTTVYLGKDKDGNPIAKPWIPNQPIIPGVEVAFHAKEEDSDHAS